MSNSRCNRIGAADFHVNIRGFLSLLMKYKKCDTSSYTITHRATLLRSTGKTKTFTYHGRNKNFKGLLEINGDIKILCPASPRPTQQ